MTSRILGAVTWMAASLLFSGTARAADDEVLSPERGEQLYLANCARCHGVSGDGHGDAELKRSARSFRAGSFSFGDTPEALLRTITDGIPGTEMPSFQGSWTRKEQQAIVDHVRTLMPERRVSSFAERELVVGTEPAFARGHLPPIGPGLPLRPRGLLIGLPGGLSFEYRTDDVRLLAVRTGAFVDRTDWDGRGGTTLKPLGEVVHLPGAGDPEPEFLAHVVDIMDRDEPVQHHALSASFRGTWVRDGVPGLSYELRDADGTRVRVEETLGGRADVFGRQYMRRLRIEPVDVAWTLVWRPRGVTNTSWLRDADGVSADSNGEEAGRRQFAVLGETGDGGRAVVTVTVGERAGVSGCWTEDTGLFIAPEPGRPFTLEIRTVLLGPDEGSW